MTVKPMNGRLTLTIAAVAAGAASRVYLCYDQLSTRGHTFSGSYTVSDGVITSPDIQQTG